MSRVRWSAGPVTGEVLIGRPVHEVYGFYRDFSNLPRFLGDVRAVRQVDDRTYRWDVEGPLGARIPLTVTITEEHPDRVLRYRSSGPPPLRGEWELAFAAAADGGGTRVGERLVVPLGGVGRAALALVGKFPEREVSANLIRLKQVLEAERPDPPRAADPSDRPSDVEPGRG